MSANLGWLFYKDYFDGIIYKNMDTDSIKKQNQETIENKLETLFKVPLDIEMRIDEDKLGNAHFKATTTYPGLLLGIGNGHELPSVKGQAILGFHFDYTSGLPEITGSSIKGVLRSAFNASDGYGYIEELLEQIDETLSFDKETLKVLELEIFEGMTKDKEGEDEHMQKRDVFFDAYITNAVTNILGDDYITPHGDNPLTEPIPLRFIKVLPEVTFMFDFELHGGKLLSAENKRKLFMYILDDLGLGAKTNVGYGYFENYTIVRTEAEKVEEDRINEERLYKEAIASDDIEKVKRFKDTYPKNENIDQIEKKIQELDNNTKIIILQSAWDNTDKNNKKHIESFIKKHQDNPLAEDIVIDAHILLNKSLESTTIIDFDSLLNKKSLKEMTHALQKYTQRLSDDEVKMLVTYIESDDCKNDLKKKKDFKFTLFKSKLGDEMGQALGDKLFGN